MQDPPAPPPDDPAAPPDESGRRLLLRTLGSVVLLFALVGVGAFLFKEPIQAAGLWFVEKFGLLGIAIGVLASDGFGVPVPPDTYLVAAVTGGADPVPVLAVVCAASVLGGNIAYVLGQKIGRWRWVQRLMARYKERGERLFRRWGVSAVTIAAWTPVPFMVVSWFAGVFDMPYKRFFLATLHRIPRHIAYYLIIVGGWWAGS